MKKQVEFTGKKVQDAVNDGLKVLGIALDDAEISIISSGGLFKKAKVLITYDDGLTEEQAAAQAAEQAQAAKPEKTTEEAPQEEPRWNGAPAKREPTVTESKPAKREAAVPESTAQSEETPGKPERAPKQHNKRNKPEQAEHNSSRNRESVLPTEEQVNSAKGFLTELLRLMNVVGEVEITVDEGMRININTEDSRVIGHRGEVLDSMQQLISSQINTEHGKFVHVTVDGLGYRNRRKDTLISLALRMADKAVKTHRKVTLDAMNSANRRIIHAALGEREDVFTRSEGHEPTRRVVIIPKRR